jgi:hypothetical protein
MGNNHSESHMIPKLSGKGVLTKAMDQGCLHSNICKPLVVVNLKRLEIYIQVPTIYLPLNAVQTSPWLCSNCIKPCIKFNHSGGLLGL